MTTIYLDMDGVVADFDSYARKILNTDKTTHSWPHESWKKIASNPRLYRDLNKTSEADKLVNFCQQIVSDNQDWNLLFLTAVPKDDDMPWAYYDKILWVQKYYPTIPVMFGPHSYDKWKHCRPGDILIDDRPSNYEDWITKGQGKAILHRGNLSETIQELSKLL
jgi:5'(3')-deoxyribonucleotidase